HEPTPPLADRIRRHPQIPRDLLVRRTRLGARQHDPRPQRQRLRRFRPPRPPHQLATFLIGQRQLGLRAPSPRHTPDPSTYPTNLRRRTLVTGTGPVHESAPPSPSEPGRTVESTTTLSS